MYPIIIDTDPGVDDAMAIAFALAHPEIELVGLTTVFGNVPVARATRNALALAERFGVPSLPVAQGAKYPLVQSPLPHPDFVHGADGLGNMDYDAPQGQAVAQSAAEFIVEQANRLNGELTVVAIGPLTNLALALKLDPDLPSKLRSLVIMGGAVDEPGNVSPIAEANFLSDPHAADVVLGADWPAVIVGLDVTHKIILTDSNLAQLRDNAGETGKLLWETSRFYVNYYSNTGAASDHDEAGCCMHDAAAVAYVVAPELFTCISGPVRVISEGVGAGQLTINRKGYTYLLKHWEGRPAAKVCMDLEVEKVRSLFLDTIIQHKVC
ncbi:nucleoside hydrolase [Hahella aquimaris]|uniref:nucleoside hydrolase n=1 Tax=Hahella sp. HNIBRBA332 TaxID=3015983 RepID=UPI00273B1FAD|nr:nucleoside hydrolase [Hahella sp. HNIBRBA332]WLQ15349.1 nucleoside hydrolase [Hahella sp. HNIBRBA332]